MKWALLSVFVSSSPTLEFWAWAGSSFDSRAREKKDWGCGCDRLSIDLPGVGIVTADEEADGESISAAFLGYDDEDDVHCSSKCTLNPWSDEVVCDQGTINPQ